eukprot:CAMPEP_0117544638 /NCGR_PEP_ID=MMETSP0784-20121206/45676_1 /TAXON_ID=39447 /ORGANISM="" /LENGTH=107 /DNA_ID=CAMNT_0005341447 /DNA_START=72 /DNA_END=395 /DNA_ORIENTATION=-
MHRASGPQDQGRDRDPRIIRRACHPHLEQPNVLLSDEFHTRRTHDQLRIHLRDIAIHRAPDLEIHRSSQKPPDIKPVGYGFVDRWELQFSRMPQQAFVVVDADGGEV